MNENSIGIEMCVNKDGYFRKTYKSTLELTKYLMDKYNILLENIVRHYDASRKNVYIYLAIITRKNGINSKKIWKI